MEPYPWGLNMADDVLRLYPSVNATLRSALPYSQKPSLFADPVRFGYSCDHRLDVGPSQMRPNTIHEFPFEGEENRCRACVQGTCVQRVEHRAEGYILVVHDCRSELS
jgi:hypothetical protein